MSTFIREATLADYDFIDQIFAEGDAYHSRILPQIFQVAEGWSRPLDYISSIIDAPDAALFLAEREGEVAGLINILVQNTPAWPFLVPRRYAIVDSIIVKERFRCLGIGRLLMVRARAWAKALGAESIELSVWAANKEVVSWYKLLGFEPMLYRMTRDMT